MSKDPKRVTESELVQDYDFWRKRYGLGRGRTGLTFGKFIYQKHKFEYGGSYYEPDTKKAYGLVRKGIRLSSPETKITNIVHRDENENQ